MKPRWGLVGLQSLRPWKKQMFLDTEIEIFPIKHKGPQVAA